MADTAPAPVTAKQDTSATAPVDAAPAGAPPVDPATGPAQPKAPDSHTEQLARLMRQDAQLKRREAALKGAEPELAEYRSLRDLAKTNKLAVLEKLGISVEEVIDHQLNNGKPTTESLVGQLQGKINELEKRLADRDEATAEEKNESIRNQVRGEITSHVKANAEKYELIHAEGAHGLVYKVIAAYARRTLDETGTAQVLDLDKACEYVENHLTKKREPLLGLKKFQKAPPASPADQAAQAGQKPNEPAGSKATEPVKATQKPKTLTQQQATSAPARAETKLSREERRKQAAQLLRFNT